MALHSRDSCLRFRSEGLTGVCCYAGLLRIDSSSEIFLPEIVTWGLYIYVSIVKARIFFLASIQNYDFSPGLNRRKKVIIWNKKLQEGNQLQINKKKLRYDAYFINYVTYKVYLSLSNSLHFI
jgi:hypothetical protein